VREIHGVYLPVGVEAAAATEAVPRPLPVAMVEAAERDRVLDVAVAARFDVGGFHEAVEDGGADGFDCVTRDEWGAR